MVELTQRSKPYQISLPYGLAEAVQALITPGMAAALAAARRAVEATERRGTGASYFPAQKSSAGAFGRGERNCTDERAA